MMADQETTSSAIDSTPISPVRPGHVRQNSLEKHLQTRPDPQDLKDRHILLDSNAAPLDSLSSSLDYGLVVFVRGVNSTSCVIG